MRKFLQLAVMLGLSLPILAQVGDTSNLFEEAPIIFGKKAKPKLSLEYSIGALSKDWNTDQLLDFSSGGFINDAQKQAYLQNINEFLEFGAYQSWEARFIYRGHRQIKLLPIPKATIYIYNRSYTSLKLSKDLVDLAFYGNKAWAGRSLKDQEINYQNWFYSGLGFQYGFLVDTIPVSFGIAFTAIHDFDQVEAQVEELLTQANGSAIDFDGTYLYRETAGQFDYSISGIGLSSELSMEETKGRHTLKLDLKDFGFAFFNSLNKVYRDTSFSFSGIQFGNLFRTDNGFIQAQGDSIDQALRGEQSGSLWRLLPFQASLEYSMRFAKGSQHSAGVSFNYIYLPAYTLKSELFYRYDWERAFLKTGFAYGGFVDWSFNFDFHWELNRHWELYLGLYNANGLAFTNASNGAGLRLALHYYL